MPCPAGPDPLGSSRTRPRHFTRRPRLREERGLPLLAAQDDLQAVLDDAGRQVLDEAGRAQAEEYDTIATAAAWHFWQKAPRADFDELKGIARLALVEAVARYPHYCADRGYDPDSSYIIGYLSQRVNGAILDFARSAQ